MTKRARVIGTWVTSYTSTVRALAATSPRITIAPAVAVRSVRLKLRSRHPAVRWWLLRLAEKAVADGQRLQVGVHEAAIRLFGRADDRFSSNVEARVHQQGASRPCL